MQRQLAETRVSLTFEYTRGYREEGSITSDDICTLEDIQSSYDQLCADKKMIFSSKVLYYPAGTYKIHLSGILDGKKIDRSFVSLDAYRNYLVTNDLIPNTIKKLVK